VRRVLLHHSEVQDSQVLRALKLGGDDVERNIELAQDCTEVRYSPNHRCIEWLWDRDVVMMFVLYVSDAIRIASGILHIVSYFKGINERVFDPLVSIYPSEQRFNYKSCLRFTPSEHTLSRNLTFDVKNATITIILVSIIRRYRKRTYLMLSIRKTTAFVGVFQVKSVLSFLSHIQYLHLLLQY